MTSTVSYSGERVSLSPGESVSVPAIGVSWETGVSLVAGVSIGTGGAVAAILLETGAGRIQLESGSGIIRLE